MSLQVGDLGDEGLKAYRTYRSVGMSEAAALAEVERSGIVEHAARRDYYTRRFIAEGMDPGKARVAGEHAARGRGGVSPAVDPLEETAARYERRYLAGGMDPQRAKAAGRQAALGGLTESEARESALRGARYDREYEQARAQGVSVEEAQRRARAAVEIREVVTPPTAGGNKVVLMESARLRRDDLAMVRRVDELVAQGFNEARARRIAFRELYGRDLGSA